MLTRSRPSSRQEPWRRRWRVRFSVFLGLLVAMNSLNAAFKGLFPVRQSGAELHAAKMNPKAKLATIIPKAIGNT